MFKFQKLEVWEKSVELTNLCFPIADNLKQKYQYSFGDQLRRALLSISNNISEGSGRFTVKEQSNFYNMAKGSVYEVVNILTVMSQQNLLDIDEKKKLEIYDLSDEICKMLTGLIRRKYVK